MNMLASYFNLQSQVLNVCIETTIKYLKSGAEMIKILMYQSYESYQNIGIACSDSDKIFLRALKIFA